MQGKQNVAALKKAYSTLANALDLAQETYAPYQFWNLTDGQDPSMIQIVSQIKPHLNIAKDCGMNSTECWIKNASDPYLANWYSFILADGTAVAIDLRSLSDSYGVDAATVNLKSSLTFITDVNCNKEPNMYGVDRFMFILTRDGLVPTGKDNESNACTQTGTRYDCASKVLREGKIDF